ncbi:MAG: glutaminyl-peptide cyclotransferase [Acidobacteriaceae bacterium]
MKYFQRNASLLRVQGKLFHALRSLNRRVLLFLLAFSCALIPLGIRFGSPRLEFAAGQPANMAGYKVVHTYPHDSSAFTQGLLYLDGHLYEGTGLHGQSSVRMVDLTTGRVLQHYDLPQQYFGEGLTDWGSTLVELTWQAHEGFVYDRFSFRLLRTFTYSGEGWGLTHDSKSLIMSDGTPYLRFLDPKTFKEVRRIEVTDRGKPVKELNELEYVRGEIYANVWMTDRIARISPATGRVLGWIDLRGLLPLVERRDDNAVLNGIAYDAKGNRLFVTGKLWPKLFEIKVIPPHSGRAK